MMKRWLTPFDVVSREQLQAAGFRSRDSVANYAIWPVDDENPIVCPGNDPDIEAVRAGGMTIVPMEWDEEEQCWIDKISGSKSFAAK